MICSEEANYREDHPKMNFAKLKYTTAKTSKAYHKWGQEVVTPTRLRLYVYSH